MRNQYTMVFALTQDLEKVLLLRKPDTHKNPVFRGKWTAPGGLVEPSETAQEGARRELFEETGILAMADELWPILTFSCNCDPSEDQHDVTVFGLIVPIGRLQTARGGESEPVSIFSVEFIQNIRSASGDMMLWYTLSLLELVIGRMKQPRGTNA